MIQIATSREDAAALDAEDPLAARRGQFGIPAGTIYLVGHSLGPQPTAARQKAQAAMDAWQHDLVRGWNTADWIDLADRTGARIARLIGAEAVSVTVTDNVSVNLFKLAVAALSLARQPVIAIEDDEFPTDQYIAAEIGRLLGLDVRRAAPGEGFAALGTGGVLIKSAVNYRSAEVADIAAYEEEARRHGAMIVWDLSHATGVRALSLEADGALMATGCTYKYLNGGPGAPAFVYLARDIANRVSSPLPGWMGHKAPFAFDAMYEPRDGAARFASGTPPILSLSALDGALDAFDGVQMSALQAKAEALGTLAIARACALGLDMRSPAEGHRRGGHISLRINDGYPVVQALAAQGVLADFRAPETVRLGFSPLFLTYAQVWDAMEALGEILQSRSWDRPEFHRREKVT
ncbi:kynureninase [Hyphomonas sp.]|uniref:kynureninase n=1 Tax=Hyphomonas sp. TaxID=87 RepID=UPI003919830A